MRRPREKRPRGHDHAIDAIAALGGLLFNESLLDRMELVRRAKPLERQNLARLNVARWGNAGTRRLPINDNCAGAAFP